MAEGRGRLIAEPAAAAALAEPPERVSNRRRPWRGVAETAGWSLLFAALIVAWARWQTGAFSLVWPYLQGERLLFDPPHVVIDDAPAGAIVERTVRVLNRSSSDVKLLGSQPSCGCITLDEFPMTVEAGRVHLLHLKIGVPSEGGRFEHTVKLFSNRKGYEERVLVVSGNTRIPR